MRGRKPLPVHLKVVTGNRGKRTFLPDNVPPVNVMPEPPISLNAEARAEWERIGAELLGLSLLTAIDTAALAAYCHSFSIWKNASEALNEMARSLPQSRGLMLRTQNGNLIQNPLVGTANKAASDMVRYAAEFGMTPSARARITLGVSPPANKFDGLIGRKA